MSRFVTEISTELPKELVYFDHLSMELTKDGLLVSAKSKVFADWISSPQNTRRTPTGKISKFSLAADCPWGPVGVELLAWTPDWSYSRNEGFADALVRELFQDRCRPNLVWLFHPELAEGAELYFRSPVAMNNWDDYFLKSCEAVSDIYNTHLRSSRMTARMKEVFDE